MKKKVSVIIQRLPSGKGQMEKLSVQLQKALAESVVSVF